MSQSLAGNLNRLKITYFICGLRRKYTQMCWQPKSPSYKNSLLIFRVNLAGRTASGLLDRWIEREEVISICFMKNDAGNVVSDAYGMYNIWKKYISFCCCCCLPRPRSVFKSVKVSVVEIAKRTN